MIRLGLVTVVLMALVVPVAEASPKLSMKRGRTEVVRYLEGQHQGGHSASYTVKRCMRISQRAVKCRVTEFGVSFEGDPGWITYALTARASTRGVRLYSPDLLL